MATYTSNYGWTKPSGSDNVDISVLNNNLDDQDSTIHDAFLNMAPPFSESSTYAVDDIVLYGTGLYKCHTAVVTPGSWTGSTNWQVYTLSEGGSGGGGTSNYNQLTNKPSINSVTLSGNKTSADLGLQDAIQIDTMPTASATYVGKVVQFVGATDANYTHGYFYECTTDGSTYSWTQLNVQPSSGGGTSDYSQLSNKPSINNVTLSGNKTTADLGISYNDLQNKPSIPAAQVNSDWNASSGVAEILNKPNLATVATSGSYTDLTNKPTIPSQAQDISYGTGTVKDALDDVTNALIYSTTEHKVGKWIDGSDLYEKTIDFGALPNNTTKTVAHGISNLDKIVSINPIAIGPSITIAFFASSQTELNCYVQGNNVVYSTNFDGSSRYGYVTLRYTKNS